MLCLQLVSPVQHMQVDQTPPGLDQTPPGLQQTEMATKTTVNEAVDTHTVLWESYCQCWFTVLYTD